MIVLATFHRLHVSPLHRRRIVFRPHPVRTRTSILPLPPHFCLARARLLVEEIPLEGRVDLVAQLYEYASDGTLLRKSPFPRHARTSTTLTKSSEPSSPSRPCSRWLRGRWSPPGCSTQSLTFALRQGIPRACSAIPCWVRGTAPRRSSRLGDRPATLWHGPASRLSSGLWPASPFWGGGVADGKLATCMTARSMSPAPPAARTVISGSACAPIAERRCPRPRSMGAKSSSLP